MKIFKNKTIFLIVSIVIILAIVILFLSYKNRPIVIDEDVCVKDLFSRLYSKSTISSDGILSASVEMMDDKESIVIKNIKESGLERRVAYRVKSGDILGRIAIRNGVTVSQLKKWNHLRSDTIRPGQVLYIYKKN